jgi:transposase-like protein
MEDLCCVKAFGRNKDGAILRCSDNKCNAQQSVRKNSFFENSHLSLHKQMQIICCFCANVTVSAAAKLLKVARSSMTDYYDNLRGEWKDSFLYQPIRFEAGGEYEVDEIFLNRVYSYRRRKYRTQWIAGILERETGKVKYYRVDDRSRHSLVPPIIQSVPPGSFIYSDEWTAYRTLASHSYVHFAVNHSIGEYARIEHFAGEEINVHINTLEGVNAHVRSVLANKSRRTVDKIDLMLAEVMYRHSGKSLFYPFKAK